MAVHGVLLAGQAQPSQSGQTFEVFAPDTGAKLGDVARGDAGDIDLAAQHARRGFDAWSRFAPRDRERVLLKAAELMEQRAGSLLDLLIDESGSAITKARYELNYTPDLLRTAAGEARRLYGDTFPNDRPDRISMVFREPVGVVGILSPYNAPLALLAKMVAFPLAAGNAVVIKPSEETPLIALAFARVLLDAGLPAEAISVVPGFGADCGAHLVSHPQIDMLALTGATHTGKIIGAAAAQHVKRVQLELGGKNALIVLKDFDPNEAARIAADGIFVHAGQICMANSRVIVEDAIHGDFVSAFKQRAESLKLGDLRDPETAYGPLIHQRAVDKVSQQQADAIEAGAKLESGGHIVRGLTYAPTIVSGTPETCALWRDESFAPVANVRAGKDLDACVRIANDSNYGLSAGILTHDVKRGLLAARQIQAGSVHVGMHPFQSNALAPIGGYKQSGIGRSGGKYSTEEFTELKWISVETGAP